MSSVSDRADAAGANVAKPTVVPIITIDGPSGAGKGTISRLVAERTGYELLDSGALYRLTALAVQLAGTDIRDEAAVEAAALGLNAAFTPEKSVVKIVLDGREVSTQIRTESVGMNASVVAAYPRVRLALLARQRSFATASGLVADGRDMGTVVFPDAQVKIFLTASAHVRATRRIAQLKAAGLEADFDKIHQDIIARDKRDSSRSVAPLVAARDALIIDSSLIGIDDVVDAVMVRVREVF